MKRILFIFKKGDYHRDYLHTGWVHDCTDLYCVKFWGLDFGKTTIKSLNRTIENFKPDYVYLTARKIYESSRTKQCWLPNLKSINVCKIFVEVENYRYNANDEWYKQFDYVYCRQKWYNDRKNIVELNIKESEKPKNTKKCMKNAESWYDVPLFRWSVSSNRINCIKDNREGIYFIGKYDSNLYPHRRLIHKKFPQIKFVQVYGDEYFNIMNNAAALICPTESLYGDFVPAKIFEYAASGAAVITNCDLKRYGIENMLSKMIIYNNTDEIQSALSYDFSKYYGNCYDLISEHNHKVRYREIFV